MKYPAKSAIVGRMPRKEGNEFKTLFVKIFDVPSPHTTTEFPSKELEISNIEKVIFKGKFPIYFLEGNDLILENISELDIAQEKQVITLSVK